MLKNYFSLPFSGIVLTYPSAASIPKWNDENNINNNNNNNNNNNTTVLSRVQVKLEYKSTPIFKAKNRIFHHS